MRWLALTSWWLAGCVTGDLTGDDGSRITLVGGVLTVCETHEGSLAAFGLAASWDACPHELDTSNPPDTGDTGDTGGTTTVDPDEEQSSSASTDDDGTICGYYNALFSQPGYCEPWLVQANSPANAHTFNVWFEDVPDREDLTGIRAQQAVVAHCPDPNGLEPTRATSLEGEIEVTRDNGRKAKVEVETDLADGKLKFRICR